ncbi:unnamed protein product [Macrosiphum euphorbiae]|uniref:Uncharacterized protein n=1 Tax=Macrosiphum euphorbiae TaxID=13131 RepID=A0AAV0VHU3_9HEMI|nr:unnamed protein product [Macrosiphum euphorbiae]
MVLLEAAQTNLRRESQTLSIQSAAEYIRLPNTESAIRLPPISLPEFDGDYKKWLNYRDTFDSFVHKHKDLSDIQKLHYLKTSFCEMKRHKSSNRWRQQLRTIYPPGSSCVSDMTTIVKWSEGTSTHYAACHQ